VEQGGQTEISVSDKLEQLRRESTECLDLSFPTICGYNAHGAIVHYMATPETDAPLRAEGLLLIDSGAQYTCGTTDITRTIALGPVTDEMRHAYTCVLKANIALATTPFPDGTCGTQIDAIARSEVWKGGYNYMHGTGHGVGWRLCVHEGPHRIHQQWFPAPLHPGMVVTDEPGIYLEGKFGIRTENVMIIINGNQTMNYELCTMNCLTLCPIDTAPIDFSMLTTKEVEWLNQYHKRVRETLLTHLSDEADKQWLIEATKEIGDTEKDK
jgi:Xaa-Pro aminopeptidase